MSASSTVTTGAPAKRLSAPRFATMTEAEIRSAERTLMAGTWAITAGALLFSVLTVTPLVKSVSPAGWQWTAPILPIVVDAAVVIVVRLDSIISRLGGRSGPWPALLRWMTGVMTLALNVGNSALHHDWVGVAVHAVAPLLLIVTAEAGLAYRRAITVALARIAREQAEQAERERADHEARERQAREECDQERARKERAEREARELAVRLEEERAAREDKRLQAEREHELALERERSEREAAERREETERLERERQHELRVEQERAARDAAERRYREEREEKARREAAAAEERLRQERAVERSLVAVPAQTARKSKVTTQLPHEREVTRVTVVPEEFAGMDPEEREAALYEEYRAARQANTYADWQENPLFQPGGPLCGSQLGIRLGRSGAAGRNNVRPKFERWFDTNSGPHTAVAEGHGELVSTG